MPIIFIFYKGSGKITILNFTERFEIERQDHTSKEKYNGNDNGVGELV